MKTEKKLNKKILKITLEIKEQAPELSKYILEMPVTIPISENPIINLTALQEYYDSLVDLLYNYTENHSVTTK